MKKQKKMKNKELKKKEPKFDFDLINEELEAGKEAEEILDWIKEYGFSDKLVNYGITRMVLDIKKQTKKECEEDNKRLIIDALKLGNENNKLKQEIYELKLTREQSSRELQSKIEETKTQTLGKVEGIMNKYIETMKKILKEKGHSRKCYLVWDAQKEILENALFDIQKLKKQGE